MTALSSYTIQHNAMILHHNPHACFVASKGELKWVMSDHICRRIIRWLCNLGGAEDRKVHAAALATLENINQKIVLGDSTTFRPYQKTCQISYSHVVTALLSAPQFNKSSEIKRLGAEILGSLRAQNKNPSSPSVQSNPVESQSTTNPILQATHSLQHALGALAQGLPKNPTLEESRKEKLEFMKHNLDLYIGSFPSQKDVDPLFLAMQQKFNQLAIN